MEIYGVHHDTSLRDQRPVSVADNLWVYVRFGRPRKLTKREGASPDAGYLSPRTGAGTEIEHAQSTAGVEMGTAHANVDT